MVLLLAAPVVGAATVEDCTDYSPGDFVEGSVDCKIADTGNQGGGAGWGDVDDVNDAALFDFDDWLFAGKYDREDGADEFTAGSEDVDFNITADSPGDGDFGTSGTWSLGLSAFFDYSDVMLLFKDGADTQPIAFRLDEYLELDGAGLCDDDGCSGDWYSPFENPPFDDLAGDETRDVSHISAFVRGEGATVPTPGSLALLGVGLLGIGLGKGFSHRINRRRASAVAIQ